MAGFLDSQQQIIDMVLTGHGKMLLSHGELRFVYWAAYDDEIQYSSPGASGSLPLTGSELQTFTEDPLQREATIGYRTYNLRGEDRTNVNRPLITVSPGWDVVPSASFSNDRSEIAVQQQPIVQTSDFGDVGMGVVRSQSTRINVSADYGKESYPRNHKLEGFYVRVLESGSHGYIEQHHTFDENSEMVIGSQLKVIVDSPGE